eukprot:snap_masked-scaffold_32-processed-gene-2.40-mRNA-1 protein AED:1.00 eAED:1.00 QI:0/-1/0/0/-1/1/1/0/686
MKKFITVRKTVKLAGRGPRRRPNQSHTKQHKPPIKIGPFKVANILANIFFGGVFYLVYNSLLLYPKLTSNFIFGAFLPLWGTFQYLLNQAVNRLYASGRHWKSYWILWLSFFVLDFTLFYPVQKNFSFAYHGMKSLILLLLSLPQTNFLNSLKESIEDNEDLMYILSQNSFLEALPLIPEFIRGFFGYDYVMTHVKIIGNNSLDFREKKDDEPHNDWAKRVRIQGFVVSEILNTEKIFLDNLEDVQTLLGDPILNKEINFDNKESEDVFIQFFKLWEQLYDAHLFLFEKLEANVRKDDSERRKNYTTNSRVERFNERASMSSQASEASPDVLNISAVSKMVAVLETCAENIFPTLYFHYCATYSLLLELYQLELTQNKSLSERVPKEFRVSLLIKPIQRITKYPLLFKELSKHLTEGRTKARLDKLAESFGSIVLFANTKASEASNMLKMAEVSQRLRIGKNEKFLALLDFEERKVFSSKHGVFKDRPHMGTVWVTTCHERHHEQAILKRLKVQHAVLFNDLVVLAGVKKSWLPPYEKYYPVKKMFPLNTLSLQPEFSVEREKEQDTLYCLALTRRDKMKLVIGFTEEERRDHWWENFREALEFATNHLDTTSGLGIPAKNMIMNENASVQTGSGIDSSLEGKEGYAFKGLKQRKKHQIKSNMRSAAMTIQDQTKRRIDTLRRTDL